MTSRYFRFFPQCQIIDPDETDWFIDRFKKQLDAVNNEHSKLISLEWIDTCPKKNEILLEFMLIEFTNTESLVDVRRWLQNVISMGRIEFFDIKNNDGFIINNEKTINEDTEVKTTLMIST